MSLSKYRWFIFALPWRKNGILIQLFDFNGAAAHVNETWSPFYERNSHSAVSVLIKEN